AGVVSNNKRPNAISRSRHRPSDESNGRRKKTGELHCGAWKGTGTIKTDDEEWMFEHSGIWEGLNRLRVQTEHIEDGESEKTVIGVKDGRFWFKGIRSGDLSGVHGLMEWWYALQLPNLMTSFNDPAFKTSSIPEIQIDGE